MQNYQNILIVRTDRIGDVVLTTPSIEALRLAYPKARLSIMVTPQTHELVEDNPCLDEVIIYDQKNLHRGFFGFWRFVLNLRKRKFDLSIIFHTKKRTNLICFLAGIPNRIGYKNNKFGFLLTQGIADTRPQGLKHEAQYCLDVLKPLGIVSQDLSLDVSIHPNGQEWLDRFITEYKINPSDKLIAIHASASDPSRCWPSKRFIELMNLIRTHYDCKILLIGQDNAQSTASEILSGYKYPVLNIVGKTRLFEFISLLTRVNILISNDSGPVHLAAGLKTPVISIFARNQPGINPERWRPLGIKSRFVSVPMNMDLDFKKAGNVSSKHLETITAQEVFEAVDALYKLC